MVVQPSWEVSEGLGYGIGKEELCHNFPRNQKKDPPPYPTNYRALQQDQCWLYLFNEDMCPLSLALATARVFRVP